jgi:hypothetical protein
VGLPPSLAGDTVTAVALFLDNDTRKVWAYGSRTREGAALQQNVLRAHNRACKRLHLDGPFEFTRGPLPAHCAATGTVTELTY